MFNLLQFLSLSSVYRIYIQADIVRHPLFLSILFFIFQDSWNALQSLGMRCNPFAAHRTTKRDLQRNFFYVNQDSYFWRTKLLSVSPRRMLLRRSWQEILTWWHIWPFFYSSLFQHRHFLSSRRSFELKFLDSFIFQTLQQDLSRLNKVSWGHPMMGQQ